MASQKAMVRPQQRFPVDVLLEDALAQHQAQALPGAPPRLVGPLVDDVPEVVETPGVRRLALRQPQLPRLAPFPGPRREAENLDLDSAALQGAGEDVGARRRDADGTPAHGAGIVDQQRHHRVAEIRFLLLLVGQGMQWVGDDARQPGGVEQPFVEVELPRPLLLGEEPALEAVGEPADDRLEILDLPVELRAKARQLLGVAQFDGLDDLVEPGGVCPVRRFAGVVAVESVRPPGMFGFARILLPVAHRLHLVGRDEIGVAGTLALRHLLRLGRHAVGRRAVALVFPALLIRPVLAGRLFPILVPAVPILRQVEVGDEPPRRDGERRLVADGFGELPKVGARLALDLVPPQVDDSATGFRRRRAGESFAQHEPHGVGQGRLLAMLHLGEAARLAFPFERVVQVPGDADHAPGAERLDPGELHGVEEGARVLPLGRSRGVQPLVVVADAQRQGVGHAANLPDLLRRQLPRRQRQPRPRAVDAGAFRSVGDLDLVVFGDGAQGRGDGPLERFDGILRLAHGSVTADSAGAPTSTGRSPPIPEAPLRCSAGSTRPRSCAPLRRTCSET